MCGILEIKVLKLSQNADMEQKIKGTHSTPMDFTLTRLKLLTSCMGSLYGKRTNSAIKRNGNAGLQASPVWSLKARNRTDVKETRSNIHSVKSHTPYNLFTQCTTERQDLISEKGHLPRITSAYYRNMLGGAWSMTSSCQLEDWLQLFQIVMWVHVHK